MNPITLKTNRFSFKRILLLLLLIAGLSLTACDFGEGGENGIFDFEQEDDEDEDRDDEDEDGEDQEDDEDDEDEDEDSRRPGNTIASSLSDFNFDLRGSTNS